MVGPEIAEISILMKKSFVSIAATVGQVLAHQVAHNFVPIDFPGGFTHPHFRTSVYQGVQPAFAGANFFCQRRLWLQEDGVGGGGCTHLFIAVVLLDL